MLVGARTDIGLVRERNEDRYHIGDRVWIVADGMGGHRAGQVASSLAVETLSQSGLEHIQNQDYAVSLCNAINDANRKIYKEAESNSELAGMGTTITVALYDGAKHLYIGHVGDSRAYLIRDETIFQLTEDHSVVAELLKDGTLSIEEAKVHPHRNYLTRALGIEKEVDVDLIQKEVRSGELILLSTDGLTNMVGEDEILDVTLRTKDPQIICDNLTEMARSRGGTDNITVVVVKL